MASPNDTDIRDFETLRCQLLETVNNDDKERLDSLLRDNPNCLDITFKYGASLLHLAAKVGSQKCLLSLLAAGRGKVVVADESGCHPLHYAAASGNLDAVCSLLVHEADINAKNKDGESPVMLACLAGNKEIASLLLEKHHEAQNLESAFCDSCQNTILHYAMIGDYQMVKQLLEKISQLEGDNVVLNQKANSVNMKGQTFLQVATEQSHRHRVEADLKQLQIIDGKSKAASADIGLKKPTAATQQIKRGGSAWYRHNSPVPLLLEAATPDYLNPVDTNNPEFARQDSKVTPITDGIIPIENPVKGSLIKKAILHKYHSVTVHPFMLEELNPNEQQFYLGVYRPTDTGRMLELLCGLHGLVIERLAANHYLVAPIVLIKCDRDNPLKIKVTIPHAWALRTVTDRPASGEIQVFTVSTAGEIPVPLPQDQYTTDSGNCVITTVISKQQLFAVAVLGEFLTLNKKVVPHIKPPAIRCICHVLLSEPVDSNDYITVEVFCAIDLPTTRKMLTEKRRSQPDAEETFVLSHDHVDMSYHITKGHGWLIPEKDHRVGAVQILPSSQSENYDYPPSWKFRVFPDKTPKKKVSNKVQCRLFITAGAVKLVDCHFTHIHPNQYHQMSASSSIDHPSSLQRAASDSPPRRTTNGDVTHTATQHEAPQISIEDSTRSDMFSVQYSAGGASGKNDRQS